jgi:hypothetical protein
MEENKREAKGGNNSTVELNSLRGLQLITERKTREKRRSESEKRRNIDK